jgi:hypothetical protein
MAYLALLSGLTISAVAIYYSVAGLVAIFAAAVVPIIVMGVVLEISKLVATVWLKLNWRRAPFFIRTYLLVAIMILMLITSMGIFGFLSKAHSDNSLVSGDVQSKIAVYDEKIRTEKENIEAARKALAQMDAAVDQTIARSTNEAGAGRAAQLRRQQAKERTQLQKDITDSQKRISTLNDERAPIAAEVRKVEAEVGPIKYIAAFIYGDNPDANLLEKAVTWIIIVIVSVFDPLAIILLLSSQYSFQWFRKEKEQQEHAQSLVPVVEPPDQPPARKEPTYDQDDEPLTNEQLHQIAQAVKTVKPDLAEKIEQLADTHTETIPPTPSTALGGDITAPEETVEGNSIDQWNKTISDAEIAGDTEEQEESAILNSVSASEKVAMTLWKSNNLDSSLKIQRRLFERGIIKELPWISYMEEANEARKWADENPETEEAKKAQEWADEISYMENVNGEQVKKTLDTYQQNAEQDNSTIWQRIKKGV